MADLKISALADGSPAQGADEVPVKRGAGNVRLSVSDIVTAAGGAVSVKAYPYLAVGDGVTNDTAAIMAAFTAAFDAGGGTVMGTPGSIYIVQGLYPLNGVKFDLNGATLKLKPSATVGILDFGDTTYAPDPTARVDFRAYVPGNGGYTGGFYQMAAGTIAAGAISVTTNTAADAGNFAAGDLAIVISGASVDTQYVAESVEVLSSNASTGAITLKWPVHKWHKSSGTYFGIAKRDAGYVSGRGFQLKNGTLDAGSNPNVYLVSYEGMEIDFDNLTFIGDSNSFYNMRGTRCKLRNSRMLGQKSNGGMSPFSVDQGATENWVINCVIDCFSANGFLHIAEPNSGTKFLYNTITFAPRTTQIGAGGQQGLTGMTFIGNTFYNMPGHIIGNPWTPDGTPATQTWIGNHFYGQFTGFINLNAPGTVADPSIGHVTVIGNVAIGTFVTALATSGSDQVIRGLSNCTVEGNHFRIVDSVTGLINLTAYASIDFDTVTIRGNKGYPDMRRVLFTADQLVDLSSATRTTVNGFPILSCADAATQTGVACSPASNPGGKSVLYGKLKVVNLGAGAGVVRWRAVTGVGSVGAALSSTTQTENKDVTMGAENVPVDSGYFLLANNSSDGFTLDHFKSVIGRIGGDGADTLANAAGILSFEVLSVPRYGY